MIRYRDKLLKLRKAHKISQKALSKLSGVTQAYISQLENGKRLNPGYATFLKLEKAFARLERKGSRRAGRSDHDGASE